MATIIASDEPGDSGMDGVQERFRTPERIQLSRRKGWKMPANTVNVARPSKWGNPFTVENTGRVPAILRFACEVAPLLDVSPLRGKNLACWCRLDQDCHADVLLELANAESQT